MGTKNNPGKFDCYEAAAPDEPMFILLARDPVAPYLVRIWASIRKGDALNAVQHFAAMSGLLSKYQANPTSLEKLQEAVDCSENMKAYYTKITN